jgi:hypothetical protein
MEKEFLFLLFPHIFHHRNSRGKSGGNENNRMRINAGGMREM